MQYPLMYTIWIKPISCTLELMNVRIYSAAVRNFISGEGANIGISEGRGGGTMATSGPQGKKKTQGGEGMGEMPSHPYSPRLLSHLACL